VDTEILDEELRLLQDEEPKTYVLFAFFVLVCLFDVRCLI